MHADGPFDRRLRRIRRDRAAHRLGSSDYLQRLMSDELLDRLAGVTRTFSEALNLGCTDGYLTKRLRELGVEVSSADAGSQFAHITGAIQCDEDRLAFCDNSFDLVVSVGALDTVNDLPGALALIRRCLRPDGLFLAAFAGAGSLPCLRSAMLAADEADRGGAVAARIHPQIDVRAAGDLLTRAGFSLPVTDTASLAVRFPNFLQLVADLRANGATNILRSRGTRAISRKGLGAAVEEFARLADADGKTSERVEIVYLTAWAPSPDQPQPARRGSATQSLAATLGRKIS